METENKKIQTQVDELKKDVQELTRIVKSLYSATTIPLEIGEAFKKRLEKRTELSTSTKDVNSEDVTINEAGSSTVTVLNDPDGFDQANINGEVHYYPYFT